MLMLLAMLTMIIDHLGVVFFPEVEWLRMIGRIAFPLYAFGIVLGYYHTSNLKKYFYRLSTLAIISQAPYLLLFQHLQLNVIFLFMVALLSIYLIDNHKKTLSFPVVIILSLITLPFIEYGLYGMLLIFIYRYTKGYYTLLGHILLSIAWIPIFGGSGLIQAISLLGTLIVINMEYLYIWKVRVNKVLYRSFYPAHLTLLLIIAILTK